jgi:hypothetical protein
MDLVYATLCLVAAAYFVFRGGGEASALPPVPPEAGL